MNPNPDFLSQALETLEQALREYRDNPHLLSSRDGCIQRFEYCYEMAVRTMRRYLALQPLMDAEQAHAFPYAEIIRKSAAAGLVAEVKLWLDFREARNKTSHAYDRKIAEEVYAMIPLFAEECGKMLGQLRQRIARND